jgi:hypothetical protein
MKRVTLYVPAETGGQRRAARRLEAALLDAYGGFTSYLHAGVWRDATGRVFAEGGGTYVVLAESPNVAIEILRDYGREAEEKAIAYTVEKVEAHIEDVTPAA